MPDPRTDRTTQDPDARAPGAAASGSGFSLSGQEQEEVEDKRPPRIAVLHEVVRRTGEEELARGFAALAWSSLAAGLTMGFSLLARGVLQRHLDGVPGAYLLENLGYTFGFLAVILARQQLFTENTITAVLPLMTRPGWRRLRKLLRLWGVVLAGNIVGGALFAFGLAHLQQFDAQTQAAFVRIGEEVLHNTPWQMATKGMLSGWIIAMMVWMMAAMPDSRPLLVLACTYLIAVSGLTHIVVGSVEVLYLVFMGHAPLAAFAWPFALPTLLGNIVGGSGIFALVSHAQVRGEE